MLTGSYGSRSCHESNEALSGFSLIELMIVLSVLSILFAVGMPAFGRLLHDIDIRGSAEGLRAGLQKARAEAEALLARARTDIQNEKNAALTEMKNQVAELSILVAERILREKLADNTAQQALVDKVMGEAEVRRS